MRYAIVSDIHGNLPALQAVVRDIARRGADRVINLGDCVSGPLLPQETAQFLMAQTDWIHLAGNHERQLRTPRAREASDAFAFAQLGQAELDWLAALEPALRLNAQVQLCHGTPRSDFEYFLESVEPTHVRAATLAEIDDRLAGCDAELIVCGHTHVPRAMRSAAGQLIVNPGSVGLPAYDDHRPCFHVIQNGSPDARYALVEQVDGGWQCDLIAVPYGHAAMAELARRNGRTDWARALASGYV
ncbi:MAG TPA: metallophosphoesterase family protein [Burkholderiaceae bacterium]|nr:metallophosphoesterase family protein [Burkholderiaceae bacterium]